MIGYAAEFEQIRARLNQGEHALMSKFYIGLKDPIKDELARRDIDLTTLDSLVEITTRIDTRVWER